MQKYKQNLIYFFIILSFGVFSLTLYYRNQLTLYIHPRYITTSFYSAIFAIAVGVIGSGLSLLNLIKNKEHNSDKKDSFDLKSIVPMIVILLFCLLISPKSLTTATASQRNMDVNSFNKNSDEQIKENVFSNFSVDTEKYSIGDWISVTRSSVDLSSFRDKKAAISGFVFKPENSPEKMFLAARFVVTCCAVDARPVGIYIEKDLKETEFKQNDWIEAKGKFDIKVIDGQNSLVLVPDSIEKIKKPSYEYLF